MIRHNAKNNGLDLSDSSAEADKPFYRIKLNQTTAEGTASAREGDWPNHSFLY